MAEEKMKQAAMKTAGKTESSERARVTPIIAGSILSSAVQLSSNAVALCAPGGLIVFANDKLLTKWAVTLDDIINKPYATLFKDFNISAAPVSDEENEENQYEVVCKKSNDALFDGLLSIKSITDGNISYQYIEIIDNTDRKLSEEIIKREYQTQTVLNLLYSMSLEDLSINELLDRMLYHLTMFPWLNLEHFGGIWLYSQKENNFTLRVSRGIENINRYKMIMHNANTKNLFDLLKRGKVIHLKSKTREAKTQVFNFFIPLISGTDNLVGALGFADRAGKRSWADNDKFFKLVANILTGVITRKLAEERLSSNNKLMHALIDGTSDLIVLLDSKETVLTANIAAQKMLALPLADIVGHKVGDFEIFRVGDAPQYININNDAGLFDISSEKVVVINGVRRVLFSKRTPLFTGNGNVSGYVEISRDITEQRQMELQLTQSQKLESVGRLAAGIAHEINTPMQYIMDNTMFLKGAIKTIIDGIDKVFLSEAVLNSPETLAFLNKIKEDDDYDYIKTEIPNAIDQTITGIDRVVAIVRAMKEFSHPGVDNKTAININQAIDSTVTIARNEWKYVADVETNFDKDLPPVSCFPGDFNQVILNLIVNAANAIEDRVNKGELKKGKITISTRREVDKVRIEIGDTGCGIPENIRGKIFDPFFTTKGIGKGTGQGLAIAHSVIVDKHKGTINFTSEIGKGAIFIITIPING